MAWLRRTGVVPALSWMALIYLLVPSFIVVPVSFTDRPFLALPRDGLSLAHWDKFLASPVWLGGIGHSLLIAAGATLLAVLIGAACAIGCWRMASRAGEVVRALMLLPLIVPSIVYALGLYRLFVDLRLLGTFTGVIIAHAVTGLPYVIITVSAALANFDPQLERAARSLGASGGQTLRLVVIPNILPGIAAGAIFCFVHSWDELVIVLFVASRRIATLPRLMWDGIHESLDPIIAVVATALMVVTLALMLPTLLLRERDITGSGPR